MMALRSPGPERVHVRHRPRLVERQRAVLCLSSARFLARRARYDAYPGQALSSDDPGQDRTLPPLAEKPDSARELLLAGSARCAAWLSSSPTTTRGATTRVSTPNPGRHLLRSRSNHSDTEGKHQAQDHRVTTPAASRICSLNFNSDGLNPLLIPVTDLSNRF